jgi:hypothetical protein
LRSVAFGTVRSSSSRSSKGSSSRKGLMLRSSTPKGVPRP